MNGLATTAQLSAAPLSAALCSNALPRATGLTDALLAPAGPELSAPVLATVTERLRASLGPTPGAPTPDASGGRLTVDAFFLRPPTAGAATPFRWTARTARRTIGLAAVRACLPGGRRAPGDAVIETMAVMIEDGRRGLGRPGGIEQWLASLAPGGTAAVAAAAVVWATGLLHAVTWARTDGAVVGPTDQWWTVDATVALRGRADIRLPVGDGGGGRRMALLTIVGGRPGSASRAALGLPALVAAAGGRQQPMPARVVGWWPECGRALVVPVDAGLLETTADAVVGAVRAGRAASSRTAVGG
jgi:hypothetical protein